MKITKKIAPSACWERARSRKLSQNPYRHQRGLTLLELMVGVVIGLLVVAVATAALMVSRSVTGTVSDASQIQQQGAYAMRVIGNQLRQAGALYLNPDPGNTGATDSATNAVAFEISTTGNSEGNDFDQNKTLSDSTDTVLKTAFRRYEEAVYISSDKNSDKDTLSRNCIGLPGKTSKDRSIESAFEFKNNSLLCGGNGQAAQPIINNVAEVQFDYLEQINNAAGTTIMRRKAAAVTNWRRVQGVEVCMVLYGTEAIDMPSDSKYLACDGKTEVKFSELTGERKNRMHLLVRSTFQLRSQGLLEAGT